MLDKLGLSNPLVFWLSLITAVLVIAEISISAAKNLKWYTVRDTINNIYLTLLNISIDFAVKGLALIVYAFCYKHAVFHIENPYIYWTTLVIAQDFFYYLLHLVDHYSRFFWAMHVTHHSSEEYNLTIGFRSSVFQPIYRILYYAPLAFMGFEGLHIMFVYQVTQTWGILVHTKSVKKLPAIIEYIFVTPSHHRVHHASNIRYLDKNMGMLLIIWDRLFGTFQEELPEEPPVYGLTKMPDDMGFANIVFHEFRALGKDLTKPVSLKDRIKYIFFPPGWSHDKSTLTANEMREKMKESAH